MRDTVSSHGGAMRAAFACLALFGAASCGEVSNPVRPLVRLAPPDTGPWTILAMHSATMTAAPSCSLPDYAATRTYTGASLRIEGRDLVVMFDPYDAYVAEGMPGFAGTRDGDAVRLTLTDDESAEYSFVYLVSEGTELAYSGTATGTMDDGGIVASLNGAFVLRDAQRHTVHARCDARDHRMELVRYAGVHVAEQREELLERAPLAWRSRRRACGGHRLPSGWRFPLRHPDVARASIIGSTILSRATDVSSGLAGTLEMDRRAPCIS